MYPPIGSFITFKTSWGPVTCLVGPPFKGWERGPTDRPALKVVAGFKNLLALYELDHYRGEPDRCAPYLSAETPGWVKIALGDPSYGYPEYPYELLPYIDGRYYA